MAILQYMRENLQEQENIEGKFPKNMKDNNTVIRLKYL